MSLIEKEKLMKNLKNYFIDQIKLESNDKA